MMQKTGHPSRADTIAYALRYPPGVGAHGLLS